MYVKTSFSSRFYRHESSFVGIVGRKCSPERLCSKWWKNCYLAPKKHIKPKSTKNRKKVVFPKEGTSFPEGTRRPQGTNHSDIVTARKGVSVQNGASGRKKNFFGKKWSRLENFEKNPKTRKGTRWVVTAVYLSPAILAYFDAARRAASGHFWVLEKRFKIKKFLKKQSLFQKKT